MLHILSPCHSHLPTPLGGFEDHHCICDRHLLDFNLMVVLEATYGCRKVEVCVALFFTERKCFNCGRFLFSTFKWQFYLFIGIDGAV